MKDKLIKSSLLCLLIISLIIGYYQYMRIITLKTELGNSYITTYRYIASTIEMFDLDINNTKTIKNKDFYKLYSYRFNALPILIRENYEHSAGGVLDYYFEEMVRKCIEMTNAIENNETEKIEKMEIEIIEELEKGRKIVGIIRDNGGNFGGYIDPVEWYDKISKNRYYMSKQIQNLE